MEYRLNQRPDITELFAKRQISEIQQAIVHAVSGYTLARVTQEVLIPNDQYPSYPFRIDFVVGEMDGPQLAVEIDGHYHDKPEAIARDQRKTEKMEEMGYMIMRIRYEIPRQYIYGGLQGAERVYVKQQYERWRRLYIDQIASEVATNYEILTKAKI